MLKTCSELDAMALDDEPFYQSLFLNGYCDIFAIAMHELCGFDIFLLKNEEVSVVHYFCIINDRNQKMYYDVRGFSHNIKEFLEEFKTCFNIKNLLNGYLFLQKQEDVSVLKEIIISIHGKSLFNKIYNQAQY